MKSVRLSATGRRRMQRATAGTVAMLSLLTVLVSVTGGSVRAAVDEYVGLSPARLFDSRTGNTQVPGGPSQVALAPFVTVPLQVSGRGNVPASAGSVVLNVVGVNARAAGQLTVVPCGVAANASAATVNLIAGRAISNAIVVRLGTAGRVCLSSSVAAHVVVDVSGYFPTGSPYTPLAPARLMDSRPGSAQIVGGPTQAKLAASSVTTLQVSGRAGVPTGAKAAVLSVIARDSLTNGYVTVWPCAAQRPRVSALNQGPQGPVGNTIIAALSAQGTVCVFTISAAHISIDVHGYLPSGSSLVTQVPERLLDTRPLNAQVPGGPGQGLRGGGTTTEMVVAGRGSVPANAGTVLLNVTAVNAVANGYLTIWPCGVTRQTSSALNVIPSNAVANTVVAQLGVGGKVCIFASSAMHVIIDISGSYPTAITPPPPTTAPPTTLAPTTAAPTTVPPTTVVPPPPPPPPPSGAMIVEPAPWRFAGYPTDYVSNHTIRAVSPNGRYAVVIVFETLADDYNAHFVRLDRVNKTATMSGVVVLEQRDVQYPSFSYIRLDNDGTVFGISPDALWGTFVWRANTATVEQVATLCGQTFTTAFPAVARTIGAGFYDDVYCPSNGGPDITGVERASTSGRYLLTSGAIIDVSSGARTTLDAAGTTFSLSGTPGCLTRFALFEDGSLGRYESCAAAANERVRYRALNGTETLYSQALSAIFAFDQHGRSFVSGSGLVRDRTLGTTSSYTSVAGCAPVIGGNVVWSTSNCDSTV